MAGDRTPLSKKRRFDVFKRDGFVCQYCGSTPPAVVLEVDHLTPVSDGGGNEIDNLISACFDCNRGKGADGLHVAPLSVAKRTALIRERELQVQEYEAALSEARRLADERIDWVSDIFAATLGCDLTDTGRNSVRLFLERLPPSEVLEAAELACHRIDDAPDAFKYFCGICWKKIRA